MGEAEAEALECIEAPGGGVGWTPVAPRVTKGRTGRCARFIPRSSGSFFFLFFFLHTISFTPETREGPHLQSSCLRPAFGQSTRIDQDHMCLGAVGKVPGRVGSFWEGQPNQRRLGMGTFGTMA